MISLIRKCPRDFNFSLGRMVTASQVTRQPTARNTSTSNKISSSKIVTTSPKRFADLKPTSKKLPSLNYQYRDIHGVFPDILHDLSEMLSEYKLDEAFPWLSTILEYNLRNAEANICFLTVLSYENLAKSENLSPENMRLAHVLGWSTEILNTALLMLDDIMDRSSFRRGQPCWHTLDNVGVTGINDALLILSGVFALLEKNFRHLDCYMRIMKLFHDVLFRTACGESLDIELSKRHVSSFNMESYKIMAIGKATYDNFYLPFAVAAQFAGFTDEEALQQSRAIILEIGLFFQIQNDYLDCFGTLETAGKIGTDIEDNKYSWLAVACMERATDEQKQIMIDCYAKKDPEMVQQVKELYMTLDLPRVFAAYKAESYNKAKSLIEKNSNVVPSEIFFQILNRIYHPDS